MSLSLPNGSTVAGSASLAVATAVTAVTNALPASVASLAHGLAVGDYVMFTSGWARLNNRVFRVLAVPDLNDFTLEGIDTTNVAQYPVGAGAGSVAKVLTWTPILQVMTSASAGGDTQFFKYQFLESQVESQIPTHKNAATWTLTLADDVTEAGYQWADTSDHAGTPQAIKVSMPNGAHMVYQAYVSLNRIPIMDVNKAMEVKLVLSLLNDPTRYAT